MKPSQIAVQTVTQRLRAAMGVDPRGLDPARLLWILESRCRDLKLPHASAYVEYLEETPAEIEALIEEAVVRETRFFRDPSVFDHIRAAVVELAAATTGPIRILSAPCGTGEEAYSLAALLQQTGVVASRFTIDALDISGSALDIARQGVYPQRALAQAPPDLQQACATHDGKHWRVHDVLRERIHFARLNLAQRDALGEAGQYHLILCRNLFIYLAPEARAALAQSLATALLPGGRLFLGTADRVEEIAALFAPMRPAASFGFVHRTSAGDSLPRQPRAAVATTVRHAKSQPASSQTPETVVTTPLPAAQALLKRALELRQLGESAKAERRCRQALYLAPNLLPALELLQSLWSDHPNLRQRRALRDRVGRIQSLRPAAVEAANFEENA